MEFLHEFDVPFPRFFGQILGYFDDLWICFSAYVSLFYFIISWSHLRALCHIITIKKIFQADQPPWKGITLQLDDVFTC